MREGGGVNLFLLQVHCVAIWAQEEVVAGRKMRGIPTNFLLLIYLFSEYTQFYIYIYIYIYI
jgi:hypothetical protein